MTVLGAKETTKLSLPAPLVSPKKHPITWARHRLALLGTAAIGTYIGVLIIAALYYLVLELWAPATHAWHNAVPNSELRHNIRDVGEGLFGGLLAHAIIWNHYKKSITKKRNWRDKLEIALHIPNVKDERTLSGWQLLLAVPIVLIYALPGFFIAEAIVHAINPYVAVSHGTSAWDNIKGVVVENYPQKLIGYSAAFFFGRRPAKGIFDDLQLWFTERRVLKGTSCRWYHVPTYKARCNSVSDAGCAKDATGTVATYFMRALVPIGLALAVFGYLIINNVDHIAK